MNADAILSFIRQLIPFYLAFDGIVFALMIYQQIASNATRDWPSVPGQVLTSKVLYKSGTNRSTSPEVTYTYEVHGKTHKGGGISPGGISSSGRKFSEKVVARYPKGADVTVYYNPKNPSEACLERYSIAKAQEWKWLIGGTLMLPFIALLIYWIKHSQGM